MSETSVESIKEQPALNTKERAWQQMRTEIEAADCVDLNRLRTLSWNGIPKELRPQVWKLLLGYCPAVRSRRDAVLNRKRADYKHLVQRHFDQRGAHEDVYRQIHIDIPRMQPLMRIFQQIAVKSDWPIVQTMFERILFIWSIRHPASGYVQGMNDLVTPFFVTYLSEHVPGHSLEAVERLELGTLPDGLLQQVEADSFWSLFKLLDSIQDNYTFAQPGIQNLVSLLERLMSRVDCELHNHLSENTVQYLHFSFRWMNNLLIRELPLACIIRLWDSYFSESAWAAAGSTGNSIAAAYSADTNESSSNALASTATAIETETPFGCSFHLYVCAAFLKHWSKQLLDEKDFQGLMLKLQNLPTSNWTENEIKLILAEAFKLKNMYTANHMK